MSEHTFNIVRQGRGRRKSGETTVKQVVAELMATNPQATTKEVIAMAVAAGIKAVSAQVYVSVIRKEQSTPVVE